MTLKTEPDLEEKSKPRKLTWVETIKALKKPKVGVMLALGFSSGLPFMLVGNTLGFWLRESGTTLTTIGFLSWVGLAYSFKFLWAPLVDKFDVPVLGPLLGRRRGWLILSQVLVGLSLIAMAILKPEGDLLIFTAFAALAAFASSTQDIVIDAWRIEASDTPDEMGMLSSAYQLGYRGALLMTDALILIAAASIGWSMSYMAMGILMAVGICATFLAVEPKPEAIQKKMNQDGISKRVWDAIAGPFIDFFKKYGAQAVLILLAISFYRLPDFAMGPMANPFYADLKIPLETVGAIRGSVGLIASWLGIALGGLSAIRFGFKKTLIIGAIIGPLSNVGFSVMAMAGPSKDVFAAVMFVDNISSGFAGTALIAYMSSLISVGYTATQYALLSSFYALLGKSMKGLSGWAVDSLSKDHTLMEAYSLFFIGTALVGIPAIVACVLLIRQEFKAQASASSKVDG